MPFICTCTIFDIGTYLANVLVWKKHCMKIYARPTLYVLRMLIFSLFLHISCYAGTSDGVSGSCFGYRSRNWSLCRYVTQGCIHTCVYFTGTWQWYGVLYLVLVFPLLSCSIANLAYLAVSRHTWLPMLIIVMLNVTVLFFFLLLYKTMIGRKVYTCRAVGFLS